MERTTPFKIDLRCQLIGIGYSAEDFTIIEEEFALEYLINLVKNDLDTKKYAKLKDKPHRLSYLRAIAINSLIQDAIKVFTEKIIIESHVEKL